MVRDPDADSTGSSKVRGVVAVTEHNDVAWRTGSQDSNGESLGEFTDVLDSPFSETLLGRRE
jgi:hypothetical protein